MVNVLVFGLLVSAILLMETLTRAIIRLLPVRQGVGDC